MYIRDSRTLLGAVALILSGAILMSLISLYFDAVANSGGLATNRWWWEIVLNLQIVSAACIWFCYVDRISESEGTKKTVFRFRMISNLLIVLLPTWVALIAARFNWFEEQPAVEIINYLVSIMVVGWIIVLLVPRLIVLTSNPKKSGAGFWRFFVPARWYYLLPATVGLGVWCFGHLDGSAWNYELIPLLLYFQGAIPFLERGLGFSELE